MADTFLLNTTSKKSDKIAEPPIGIRASANI
jgi:hypothetical protein